MERAGLRPQGSPPEQDPHPRLDVAPRPSAADLAPLVCRNRPGLGGSGVRLLSAYTNGPRNGRPRATPPEEESSGAGGPGAPAAAKSSRDRRTSDPPSPAFSTTVAQFDWRGGFPEVRSFYRKSSPRRVGRGVLWINTPGPEITLSLFLGLSFSLLPPTPSLSLFPVSLNLYLRPSLCVPLSLSPFLCPLIFLCLSLSLLRLYPSRTLSVRSLLYLCLSVRLSFSFSAPPSPLSLPLPFPPPRLCPRFDPQGLPPKPSPP